MEIKEIKVGCGSPYSVFIKKGLLSQASEYISKYARAERYCIVSDDNVAPIYAEAVKTAIEKNGAEAHVFVFGHGEVNKTLSTVGEILEYLAKCSFTRSDCLIALGGGIVGFSLTRVFGRLRSRRYSRLARGTVGSVCKMRIVSAV